MIISLYFFHLTCLKDRGEFGTKFNWDDRLVAHQKDNEIKKK